MKPFRHHIRKLAWTLTLAMAALLLPASLVYAGHGHGGGHAGVGGSWYSTYHGHHPYSGGYGWTWGGYYDPYWGYDSFDGGYYGYGGYNGNVTIAPYFFGVYTPYWGDSLFGHSTRDGFSKFGDLFR
jgi:hypothetical protein